MVKYFNTGITEIFPIAIALSCCNWISSSGVVPCSFLLRASYSLIIICMSVLIIYFARIFHVCPVILDVSGLS